MTILRERLGEEGAERLAHLDRVRGDRRAMDRALPPPDATATVDADVVFAGGGLSLLVAAEAARLGLRAVVIERSRAGAPHREWNASADELSPLVETEIFSRGELEHAVVGRYREGICSFHGGTPRVVRGVLDHAVDAKTLLSAARRACEVRGVRLIDGAAVDAIGAGPSAVRIGFGAQEIVARVMVDARGAASPYATADLVCPTVGGVVYGLDDVDPEIGDILVTTEHAGEDGRQHVWEGFPGRKGELTVYLFYYARRDAVGQGSLAALYERFFASIGSYKRGHGTMLRPTFGYIPGWSRLAPAPRSPSPRVVLVGDAAARHSPLTFCGFGSMLRTFRPAAERIARAIGEGRAPGEVIHDEPIHAWTGALARVMASGALRGSAMNALLDDAFGTLEAMGNEAFAALLKDRMDARAFTTFLRRTATRHPAVYREAFGALGPAASVRWAARLAAGAMSS